jgi:hypothetical protein
MRGTIKITVYFPFRGREPNGRGHLFLRTDARFSFNLAARGGQAIEGPALDMTQELANDMPTQGLG